jgi:cytochrome c peroxidase
MSPPRPAPDLAPAAKVAFARAAQEPITPIPAAPPQGPRLVALGEQYLADRRLSHDNARSSRSRHDTRTNGACANAHDTPPHTLTPFNVVLSFGAERP